MFLSLKIGSQKSNALLLQRHVLVDQKVLVEIQPTVGQQTSLNGVVLGLGDGARGHQTLLQHSLVHLDRFALLDQALIVGVVEFVLELFEESLEVQRLGHVLGV